MSCILFITTNSGIMVTWVGIIMVARNTFSSMPALGNSSLAKAKAAIDAEISVITV